MDNMPIGGRSAAPDMNSSVPKNKSSAASQESSKAFSKELLSEANPAPKSTSKSRDTSKNESGSASSSAPARPTQKPSKKSPKSQLDDDTNLETSSAEDSKDSRDVEASRDSETDSSKNTDRVRPKDAASKEPSDSSSAKTVLRKIAAQMKSEGQDPQTASPILGILSGKPSSVPLESVPELIVTSPFVVRALGEDLPKYLSTPQSLESLSNSLDLSDEVLDRAKEMGVDPMVALTPKDLFMALGVDTQKISSELLRIRERGPMEGLSGIINGLKKSSLPIESDVPAVSGRPVIRTKDDLIRVSEAARKASGIDLSTMNPQFAPGRASAPESSNQELSTYTPASEKTDPRMAFLLENQLGNKTVSGPSSSSPDLLSVPLAKTEEVIDRSQFVRAERSTIDPYDAMSLQMEDVQKLNLDSKTLPLAPQLTHQLTPQMAPTQDVALNRDLTGEVLRLRIQEGAPGLRGPSISEKKSLKIDESADFSSELAINDKSSFADAALSSLGVSLPEERKSQFGSEKEGRSDLSSKGEERELIEDSGIPTHTHHSSHLEAGKSKFHGLLDQAAPGAVSHASSVRDMIDKAQMHLDKNGGSMRIEMGGENPVSLAIRVMDNEVSLKVSTQSDAMRDLISSEISRLQDSLTSRNLKLTEVDLGRQTFSGSHEGQKQNQTNGFMDFNSGSGSRQNPFRDNSKNQLQEIQETNFSKVGERIRNDLGKLLVRV
ncbi:MAG: hypothetical protein WCI18_12725 [Pseudomonadota bacterium]